jgi:hypothetical protein
MKVKEGNTVKLTTIRNKLGFIPEAHFENEPAGPPPKNVTLPKKWVDKIKEARARLHESKSDD